MWLVLPEFIGQGINWADSSWFKIIFNFVNESNLKYLVHRAPCHIRNKTRTPRDFAHFFYRGNLIYIFRLFFPVVMLPATAISSTCTTIAMDTKPIVKITNLSKQLKIKVVAELKLQLLLEVVVCTLGRPVLGQSSNLFNSTTLPAE